MDYVFPHLSLTTEIVQVVYKVVVHLNPTYMSFITGGGREFCHVNEKTIHDLWRYIELSLCLCVRVNVLF